MIEEIAKKLEELMQKEKIFKDSEINLNKLAKLLNTNTSYLSQVINKHFKSNFKNYINAYRIEEAQKMFTDPKFDHYSIFGIGYEVGFKSKSSFNSAFKKITGVTPSIFRETLKDKKNKSNDIQEDDED
jgi:YesN/AraC family two-component response regulator